VSVTYVTFCHVCRDLAFVDVPVAQPPLDTAQPKRGVTKAGVDLQWTNSFSFVCCRDLAFINVPVAQPLPDMALTPHSVAYPCILFRHLAFVDAPVAQPPLDTAQPGRGVTKVAVDLQWTNLDVQLATAQLYSSR
jgi:hypothetical protein